MLGADVVGIVALKALHSFPLQVPSATHYVCYGLLYLLTVQGCDCFQIKIGYIHRCRSRCLCRQSLLFDR